MTNTIDVGDPQYLAIYEMASDDILSVIQQIFLDDQHVRKPQGRMINCIGISYGSGIYKHLYTSGVKCELAGKIQQRDWPLGI